MEPSDFEGRVRAAAGAAWSVFLVGLAMHIFGWLAYLAISAGHLDCLLPLYGNLTRTDLVDKIFYFVVVFKLMVMCVFFAALFLTLWARRLRSRA